MEKLVRNLDVQILISTFARFGQKLTCKALLLVGIGANQIYSLDQWWPMILIGIGLIFILNATRGHR